MAQVSISILETLYQTFNEDTLNIGALPNTVEGGRFNVVKQDMEDGLTYAEKLKYVRSNYFGDNGSKDRVSDSRIGGLLDFIVKLYDKTKPLLYNEQVLSLSNKLYGTRYKVDLGNSGDASGDYRRKVLEQGKNDLPINWYWAARKNAYEESRLDDGQNWKKAATLSMMWGIFK